MFKTKKDKLDKDIMKENESELENLGEDMDNKSQKTINETKNRIVEKEPVNETDELKTQIAVLKEQLLRKAAEFENYKKRSENELSSFFKYANESLILDLLPVLDDFARIFKSFNEKHDTDTFKKGIELVYEKLLSVLKKQGLKEMETDGKKFDFNLHDALLQIADNNHDVDTILETAEKGFFLKDKVLRHAKVIVSSKSDDNANEDESDKDTNQK